jgi:hypothetical protein
MIDKLYTMQAYKIPTSQTISFKALATKEQVGEQVKDALNKGANIIIIREAEMSKGILEG